MKYLATIICSLLIVTAFSQKQRIDFNEIDHRVQAIRSSSPALLSRELTSAYSTDLEKVRAIFRWITDNIEYRIKQPPVRKKNPEAVLVSTDDTASLKSLDERVAELVLEKGDAVCDGYARLFKTLCAYAGIRTELITGYARGGQDKGSRRFRSNHTWNAVMIGDEWKLLDVTWASGYVSLRGDVFIKEFDEEYFLADPSTFILDHYPDEFNWTLMTNPPLLQEFRHSPYKQKGFIKYSIHSFRPSKGVIEANPGDIIQVELDLANPARDKQIGGDPFLDTSVYRTPYTVLLSPSAVLPNKTIYTYQVVSPFVQWVYILYNGDVVLRYKLIVRNKPGGLAVNGIEQ